MRRESGVTQCRTRSDSSSVVASYMCYAWCKKEKKKMTYGKQFGNAFNPWTFRWNETVRQEYYRVNVVERFIEYVHAFCQHCRVRGVCRYQRHYNATMGYTESTIRPKGYHTVVRRRTCRWLFTILRVHI
jgi:hypothetical protein